jgi:hypothetical protein
MEIFIVVCTGLAVTILIMSIHEVARELRRISLALETHCELERAPVQTESSYKRKGIEL